MKKIGFWIGRVAAFCVCVIVSLGLMGCAYIGSLIISRVNIDALRLDMALNAMLDWQSSDISMYVEVTYSYSVAVAEARIVKQTDEDGTSMLIERSQNGRNLRGIYYVDGWFVSYSSIAGGLVADEMDEQDFLDEYWGDETTELVDIGDPVSFSVENTTAGDIFTLVYEDADLSYFSELTGITFSKGDLLATIVLVDNTNVSSIRYEMEVEIFSSSDQKTYNYTIVVETTVNAFDEAVSISFPDEVLAAVLKKQNKFVLTLLAEPVGAEHLWQNQTHFESGEKAIISAQNVPDYTFLGWFEGENLFSKYLAEIFDMPSKNLTLTAKYEKTNP